MSKDKGRKEVKKPKRPKKTLSLPSRQQWIRKRDLNLLLEASSRIHRAEMQVLYTQVAHIKRAYVEKHGRLPVGVTA